MLTIKEILNNETCSSIERFNDLTGESPLIKIYLKKGSNYNKVLKFLYKNTVIRHFSKRLFWTPYPHTANIKQWSVTKVHKIFGYENFDDILYE